MNITNPFPATTRHWISGGLMLWQRRRRWTNFKPALIQCRAGHTYNYPYIYTHNYHPAIMTALTLNVVYTVVTSVLPGLPLARVISVAFSQQTHGMEP